MMKDLGKKFYKFLINDDNNFDINYFPDIAEDGNYEIINFDKSIEEFFEDKKLVDEIQKKAKENKKKYFFIIINEEFLNQAIEYKSISDIKQKHRKAKKLFEKYYVYFFIKNSLADPNSNVKANEEEYDDHDSYNHSIGSEGQTSKKDLDKKLKTSEENSIFDDIINDLERSGEDEFNYNFESINDDSLDEKEDKEDKKEKNENIFDSNNHEEPKTFYGLNEVNKIPKQEDITEIDKRNLFDKDSQLDDAIVEEQKPKEVDLSNLDDQIKEVNEVIEEIPQEEVLVSDEYENEPVVDEKLLADNYADDEIQDQEEEETKKSEYIFDSTNHEEPKTFYGINEINKIPQQEDITEIDKRNLFDKDSQLDDTIVQEPKLEEVDLSNLDEQIQEIQDEPEQEETSVSQKPVEIIEELPQQEEVSLSQDDSEQINISDEFIQDDTTILEASDDVNNDYISDEYYGNDFEVNVEEPNYDINEFNDINTDSDNYDIPTNFDDEEYLTDFRKIILRNIKHMKENRKLIEEKIVQMNDSFKKTKDL